MVVFSGADSTIGKLFDGAVSVDLFRNATWLNADQFSGYGLQPIPGERDRKIQGLLEEWESLEPDVRTQATEFVSDQQSRTLVGFALRMASASVRTGDEALVFWGVLAAGVDGWRFEPRENVTALCLLYDAAIRIGANPVHIFDRARSLLPEKIASTFQDYMTDPRVNRSIGVMGYVATSDPDGFRYKTK